MNAWSTGIGRLAAIALGVVVASAPSTPAQSDDRFDREAGRDLRVWPPDRHFDHVHMRLEIDVPDMDVPEFSAVETLRVRAIGTGRDRLELDAGPLEINSVRRGGSPQAFTHADGELTIWFNDPVARGEVAEIEISYDLNYEDGNSFAGLFWSRGRPKDADPNRHAPQIHTQGQPESNSRWFACHDFPNDRLSTELLVTVPEGYQVLSNGALVTPPGGERVEEGRSRWHWVQERPHVNYLVTLVIGKFDIVDLGGPESARPGLPIRVWGPLGRSEDVAEVFADTPEMIRYFEGLLDEPYPWAKYDQVVARAYSSGAMENTSASTFFPAVVEAPPGAMDGIIAHELIHQWFGDLLTCRTWAHIWLNEGWASMGQALWAEQDARLQEGSERAADEAYLEEIAGFLSVQRSNQTTAPEYPPLVSNRYSDPFQVFMKANNPYAKGALVLHMLREGLGDEVFFRAVADYIDLYRFEQVETSDFREVLERHSGLSLERFFDQWAHRPGIPSLEVEFEWDDQASELVVVIEQTQAIDARNPAYHLQIPVLVTQESGQQRYEHVLSDRRQVTARFALPGKPAEVVLDPRLRVAARSRVTKPLAMWLGQLEAGPTVIARLRAAEHLHEFDDARARRALARLAGDGSAPPILREAAGVAPETLVLRTIPAGN